MMMKKRDVIPELMDNRDSDISLLYHTLDQFVFINRLFCRAQYCISKLLLPRILSDKKENEVTIVDLGAGGCDFGRSLADRLDAHGLNYRIICIDNDSRVVAYARKKCALYPKITIEETTAVQYLRSNPKIDYIYANHFLHHLGDDEIIEILNLIEQRAGKGYMLNDLSRSYISYWFYSLFAVFFLHNSFSRKDGLISIKKGFTKEELGAYCCKSKLHAQVKPLFPGRLLLSYFT